MDRVYILSPNTDVFPYPPQHKEVWRAAKKNTNGAPKEEPAYDSSLRYETWPKPRVTPGNEKDDAKLSLRHSGAMWQGDISERLRRCCGEISAFETSTMPMSTLDM